MKKCQKENGSIFLWLLPNLSSEVSFCSLNTELQNDTKIARFGNNHEKIQATCLYGTFFRYILFGTCRFFTCLYGTFFSSHVFMAHFFRYILFGTCSG